MDEGPSSTHPTHLLNESSAKATENKALAINGPSGNGTFFMKIAANTHIAMWEATQMPRLFFFFLIGNYPISDEGVFISFGIYEAEKKYK